MNEDYGAQESVVIKERLQEWSAISDQWDQWGGPRWAQGKPKPVVHNTCYCGRTFTGQKDDYECGGCRAA